MRNGAARSKARPLTGSRDILTGLAVNQVGKLPGISGLTFSVDGDEAGGRLSINSRKLNVDAPGVMREPLSFATLTGQAGWKRDHGELTIQRR